MQEMMNPTLEADDEMPALPLPEVVDTPAVVLAGMLSGGTRPLVLDAANVREIHSAAAGMLLVLLRAKRSAGAGAAIVAASPALRRGWAGHPLAAFFAADAPGAATYGAEALFVCPDREGLGFAPSGR
ncbi:MAG TPA: STAS domain-containing protein [Longimicrobium sp.]|nr:STAS domain-containing protein [Longimicrobium sp.]